MKNVNFVDFQKELMTNPQLQAEFKSDPVEAIKKFQPILPDTWVYRMVVGSLGLAILLVIVSIVILEIMTDADLDSTVATLFTAIASGAVGALAGLLAPSPK